MSAAGASDATASWPRGDATLARSLLTTLGLAAELTTFARSRPTQLELAGTTPRSSRTRSRPSDEMVCLEAVRPSERPGLHIL